MGSQGTKFSLPAVQGYTQWKRDHVPHCCNTRPTDAIYVTRENITTSSHGKLWSSNLAYQQSFSYKKLELVFKTAPFSPKNDGLDISAAALPSAAETGQKTVSEGS